MSEMLDQLDQKWMLEALKLAQKAFSKGEVPVGAVVVYENQIIGRGYNQVELLKDATAHAEMIALTAAQQALGDWRLNGCTLYVTKEPCPMCAGAIVLCRISRLVYGTADCKLGAAGGAINLLNFPGWNHHCEIKGMVLDKPCKDLLLTFFRKLRSEDSI